MTAKQQKTKRRSLLFFYIYGLLILAILLTAASYAWFSISRTPRVSDLGMHITTGEGLELASSYDAQEWTHQLDFVDLVDETAPLRPATWSEKNQRFYAATYGIDGRLTDQWQPLTDANNAYRDNFYGYYTKITFYARTKQSVAVSLSPAVAVSEGLQGAGTYVIGTPLWNGQSVLHDNGGSGAENAVRVGFRITKVNAEGKALQGEDPTFIIYEPNADSHLDGSGNYIPTPSIDGAAQLVPEDRLITQTTSSWREAYPVQRDVLIHELGEFTSPTELFKLDVGELVKIDLYVWLEGQDVDCTNRIKGAQILANVQFSSKMDGQSGLEIIN